MKKKYYTIAVDYETYKKVKEFAIRLGTSIVEIIRVAVDKFIKEKEKEIMNKGGGLNEG